MSNSDAPDVVQKSLTVNLDAAAAFRIWTEQIHTWWPAGHSRSGDPGTRVIIEGREGGRFYERTPDGVEYEWGRVTAWEPPAFLAYTWYLGSGPELPTRVEVRFVVLDAARTRIDIEHRGPEWVGALWWQRQSRFVAAWETVLAAYAGGPPNK